MAVKRILAQRLNEMLEPIRQRRAEINESQIRDMVMTGTEMARKACIPVVEATREKMHLKYPQ